MTLLVKKLSTVLMLLCFFQTGLVFAQKIGGASIQTISCDGFLKGIKLTRFLLMRSQLARLSRPLWLTHRPETTVSVFFDSKVNLNCGVLLNGSIASGFRLAEPLVLQNQSFEFYIQGHREVLPVSLQSIFRQNRIILASVFDLNGITDSLEPDPTHQKFGIKEFFEFYIHENFHLHSIFAYQFKIPGSLWPVWDRQPDRQKTARECYLNPLVKQQFQIERTSLINATNEAVTLGRNEVIRRNAINFLQARAQRHSMLKSVKVPAGRVYIGCPEAEVIFELEEGLAKYIGAASLYYLGIYNSKELMSLFHLEYPEDWFYYSGLGQMLLLKTYYGAQLDKVTQRIATSRNWNEGINFEMRKLFLTK